MLALSSLAVIAAAPAYGQTSYAESLGAAIRDWQANLASGAEVQTGIASRFEEIAADHPSGWEASFWASHAITQIPGHEGESAADHFGRAQRYLDEAIARYPDAPDKVVSEFHMLQSLIHSNHGFAADEEDQPALYQASGESQDLAEQANPDNPRAWMFRGFDLIRRGEDDAGRIMLTKALGKWDAYPPENELAPNWGKQWIDFWMGGAEKRERRELPPRDGQS